MGKNKKLLIEIKERLINNNLIKKLYKLIFKLFFNIIKLRRTKLFNNL